MTPRPIRDELVRFDTWTLTKIRRSQVKLSPYPLREQIAGRGFKKYRGGILNMESSWNTVR